MNESTIIELRLQNLSRQASLVASRRQSPPLQPAAYQRRDRTTGDRLLQQADGGRAYGSYLSNSRPGETVALLPGSLSRQGRLLSRPV